VLRTISWEPISLEVLVERSGLGFGPASAAVARLEADGWIARSGGAYERVARSGGRRL
jgi:predicted Rossmann fold nucleotide-binding protein DprA/Smf involved in DNA uptake